MASIRNIKKEIDYLTEEVISNCYLTIYFQPEKKEAVLKLMQEAVKLRNDLIDRSNNPVEKNNGSLVKKHYAQIRKEMLEGVDSIFIKLGNAVQNG